MGNPYFQEPSLNQIASKNMSQRMLLKRGFVFTLSLFTFMTISFSVAHKRKFCDSNYCNSLTPLGETEIFNCCGNLISQFHPTPTPPPTSTSKNLSQKQTRLQLAPAQSLITLWISTAWVVLIVWIAST